MFINDVTNFTPIALVASRNQHYMKDLLLGLTVTYVVVVVHFLLDSYINMSKNY